MYSICKFARLYVVNSKILFSYKLTLKVSYLVSYNFLTIDFED